MGRDGGSRLRLAFGVVLVIAVVLVPATATASGGGGCGGPVTDERGTEVAIADFCFTPTILRVATGDVVTFTNMDRFPHSVLGANATWGDYDGFRLGRPVTYRFEEPGVYPYVCTYHVGMVGVVVVGSGAGGAIDTTTGDGPVVRAEPADLELRSASTVPAPASHDAFGWAAALTAGLVLGVAGTMVVGRRRRRAARARGEGVIP